MNRYDDKDDAQDPGQDVQTHLPLFPETVKNQIQLRHGAFPIYKRKRHIAQPDHGITGQLVCAGEGKPGYFYNDIAIDHLQNAREGGQIDKFLTIPLAF